MLTTFFVVLIVALLIGAWHYSVPLGRWLYRLRHRAELNKTDLRPTRVTLDGIEHHVWLSPQSDKPVLLCLHGFSADHRVWLPMARYLQPHFQLVCPDLAGHGATGYSSDWDCGMPAQTQRMLALMDHLGHSQFMVIGNSMGGLLAAHLCAAAPERVSAMMVLDPAGVGSPEPSVMQQMLAVGNNPFLIDSDDDFRRFLAMTMARPPYLPGAVVRALAADYRQRKPALAQIFADFHRADAAIGDALDSIQTPTLVLWGGQDALIHVSAAARWQEATGGVCYIWEDLGHMPMMEAPRRTASTVMSFTKDMITV
ncbi:alpha/beta fold hydrolase [Aestuariibacter halophilus]|uniref:Alpha/beta fold hydrolase n=1 Tax=Fluctibacter halophilus TaxID=226011 RepID=A0ABS8G9W4_9ALTE|nr:alpha/beta fold hydrolase [Aestuariibacter halophilus]MCC2616605.1 alpha/beta fold hydrolase [Aestuariibacter halophilus]